jgi:hypothetical protein
MIEIVTSLELRGLCAIYILVLYMSLHSYLLILLVLNLCRRVLNIPLWPTPVPVIVSKVH